MPSGRESEYRSLLHELCSSAGASSGAPESSNYTTTVPYHLIAQKSWMQGLYGHVTDCLDELMALSDDSNLVGAIR